jgi:hypothetical protein
MRIVSSTRVGDCKCLVGIDEGRYQTWNEVKGVIGKPVHGNREQTFELYDTNVELLKMQRSEIR